MMKRHKHKPYRKRWEPDPRDGCQWYHEWFGVCCNGDSKQRGDISERCELYEAEEPLTGVTGNDD